MAKSPTPESTAVERHLDRIRSLLNEVGTELHTAYEQWLEDLRARTGREITREEAADMVAFHFFTKRVVSEPLFGQAAAARNPLFQLLEPLMVALEAALPAEEVEEMDGLGAKVMRKAIAQAGLPEKALSTPKIPERHTIAADFRYADLFALIPEDDELDITDALAAQSQADTLDDEAFTTLLQAEGCLLIRRPSMPATPKRHNPFAPARFYLTRRLPPSWTAADGIVLESDGSEWSEAIRQVRPGVRVLVEGVEAAQGDSGASRPAKQKRAPAKKKSKARKGGSRG